MSIRPVRTEEDYSAALERIEELWGAEPGTAEGDELDILLLLVEDYEDKHHPVPPPSPIEAIKFVMDQKGLKQADLVPFMGSHSKVSEVLSGKRSLTLSMIRALHEELSIPAEVLITEGQHFPENGQDIPWDRFPVKEIVGRKWVTGLDPNVQAEEIIRKLAAQAGSDDYLFSDAACFRQGFSGTRRNKKDNPYAIQAWLLGLLSVAADFELGCEYRSSDIDASLLKKIAGLSELSNGPLVAREYLASRGIKLVCVRHFKRTYLDGAVLITKDGTPIIGMSLRHDRIDNFWFTLLHELSHLALQHVQQNGFNCIIDDLDLKPSQDDIEHAADKMAMEALIPQNLWASHPAKDSAKISDVRDLARKAHIHPAIVAGRVRYHRNNYRLLARHVGHGEVRKLFEE